MQYTANNLVTDYENVNLYYRADPHMRPILGDINPTCNTEGIWIMLFSLYHLCYSYTAQ